MVSHISRIGHTYAMSATALLDPLPETSPPTAEARSVTGRLWRFRDRDDRAALAIAQKLGVPEAVARVVAGRGVGLEEADAFLNPSLKNALPDPLVLKDMAPAANLFADSVISGRRIAIFGDYDVDGTTAAAILALYLKALGREPLVHLPDRLTEGYGPNAQAFQRLKDKGAEVLITVDCGATAHDAMAAAAGLGLDAIVVDHHQMGDGPMPAAAAVVNPNRPDDVSGLENLSAAGVAFMLIVAANRTLRQRDFFKDKAEPNLLQWLDLVALGLVCDVMPLTGLARVLTAQGLKVLARRDNAGLAALSDVAAVKDKPTAYSLGFLLGPRINAGGRVAHPQLGFDLLTTDDPVKAEALAQRLNELNRDRQSIEAGVLDAATAEVEQIIAVSGLPDVIVVAGEGWHPGVIGIVAGRLKEKYGRPAIVIGVDPATGEGKGSGRSLKGVDLGGAVRRARSAGFLVSGGGHAMAAGLTVLAEAIPALAAFVAHELSEAVAEAINAADLTLDDRLSVRGADRALAEALAEAGPFGPGNPEPVFLLSGVRVRNVVIRGERHVICTLGDETGGAVKAVAFRAVGEPLGEALLAAGDRPVDIAARLRKDDWRGGAELHILDLRLCDQP
ncbi:MAG: single-stranded-DNA-specific exonuclease RecJ [Pseudomonadota bacterium]